MTNQQAQIYQTKQETWKDMFWAIVIFGGGTYFDYTLHGKSVVMADAKAAGIYLGVMAVLGGSPLSGMFHTIYIWWFLYNTVLIKIMPIQPITLLYLCGFILALQLVSFVVSNGFLRVLVQTIVGLAAIGWYIKAEYGATVEHYYLSLIHPENPIARMAANYVTSWINTHPQVIYGVGAVIVLTLASCFYIIGRLFSLLTPRCA